MAQSIPMRLSATVITTFGRMIIDDATAMANGRDGCIAVYSGLFAAATIRPMQSGALLAGLLISGAYSTTVLLVVASMGKHGHILGSAIKLAASARH